MRRLQLLAVIFAVTLLCGAPVRGDIIEYAPFQDANVKRFDPRTPSNDQALNTGVLTGTPSQPLDGGNNYALILFDLDGSPTEVKSVKLRLRNSYKQGLFASGVLSAYAINGPWDENTVTFVTKPPYDYGPAAKAMFSQYGTEWVELDLTALYRQWKAGRKNYGILLNTDGSDTSGICYGQMEPNCRPGSFYSSNYYTSDYWPQLVVETNNSPPEADAGENLALGSADLGSTVVEGRVSDPDGNPCTFRWLESDKVLADWQPAGANGEAPLALAAVDGLTLGEHTFTLEVSDGEATAQDTLILTVGNSPPNVVPSGNGVYEILTPVTIGGEVADFDGDPVVYQWSEGDTVLFSGTVETAPILESAAIPSIEMAPPVEAGNPVALPEHVLSSLSIGTHFMVLSVSDGVNEPVQKEITVEVVDTGAPTLSPRVSRSILWPANHWMVPIRIATRARDNSGEPVALSVMVTSSEAQSGLWRRDRAPDWTTPVINPRTGVICLKLRAERSGCGQGRVYTIYITATDVAGNSSQSLVDVFVPHHRGQKMTPRETAVEEPAAPEVPSQGGGEATVEEAPENPAGQDLAEEDQAEADRGNANSNYRHQRNFFRWFRHHGFRR
jgi:hypothetical protein